MIIEEERIEAVIKIKVLIREANMDRNKMIILIGILTESD
jgi:hypothetical protein